MNSSVDSSSFEDSGRSNGLENSSMTTLSLSRLNDRRANGSVIDCEMEGEIAATPSPQEDPDDDWLDIDRISDSPVGSMASALFVKDVEV